jgi:uncharacterized protein YecE (DUF72 family)
MATDHNKIKWDIGCPRLDHKDWKGMFYPESVPQKEWFRFYAYRSNTLEPNVNFISLSHSRSLKPWYDTSPANFSFAVKRRPGRAGTD